MFLLDNAPGGNLTLCGEKWSAEAAGGAASGGVRLWQMLADVGEPQMSPRSAEGSSMNRWSWLHTQWYCYDCHIIILIRKTKCERLWIRRRKMQALRYCHFLFICFEVPGWIRKNVLLKHCFNVLSGTAGKGPYLAWKGDFLELSEDFFLIKNFNIKWFIFWNP